MIRFIVMRLATTTAMFKIFLLLSIFALTSTKEIEFLPGSDDVPINFKHYSGYFNVSKTNFLHYWFVSLNFD